VTKTILAAQLRVHFVSQGADASRVMRMSDDQIVNEIVDHCGWCGARHVEGEKLDQVIAASLDEKHFRSLWNDYNNSLCPKVQSASV
jgi:hypothetical protein